jgi:hypothetical protein
VFDYVVCSVVHSNVLRDIESTVSSSNSSDFINEFLQESVNDGDGTKADSKEDWDSAITFTAKASRKFSCIAV